jgi:hypothetical protein
MGNERIDPPPMTPKERRLFAKLRHANEDLAKARSELRAFRNAQKENQKSLLRIAQILSGLYSAKCLSTKEYVELLESIGHVPIDGIDG